MWNLKRGIIEGKYIGFGIFKLVRNQALWGLLASNTASGIVT